MAEMPVSVSAMLMPIFEFKYQYQYWLQIMCIGASLPTILFYYITYKVVLKFEYLLPVISYFAT